MSTQEVKQKPESRTLTKRDVVLRLNAEVPLTQPVAAKALQVVLDAISECLVNGGHVEFRDFGVFETAARKPRLGRNPNKPEDTVMIPGRRVVVFKPSKRLKQLVLESDR
ncbi:MAG: HU family DNA-binding protein [Kiritimatiellia bacterium]|jgi:nucleoid DNA-binding protein